MIKLKNLFSRFRKKPAPVIETQWGPVTESARHQAAINMKLNPAKKSQVEQLLIARAGGDVEAGLKRAREYYPEAYE